VIAGHVGDTAVPFRFDRERHEYTDLSTGEIRPNISIMLERAGIADSTWMTVESRVRGRVVHKLTADHDLGVATYPGPYSGYLAGYVTAVGIMRPEWLTIEVPRLHRMYRYGGTPDRSMVYEGLTAMLEIKTGEAEKAHGIQTALQAILEAEHLLLSAESIARFCLYLKADGKFKLEEHTRRRDFDTAYRIIREQCS
jgi:hypothetical protein